VSVAIGEIRMRTLSVLVLLAAASGLAGCVVEPQPPPPAVVERVEAPPPERVAEVVAYPAQGQSEQQLDRDRYECHVWAVKQSGFDPSVAGVPPHQRVRVLAGPPQPSAIPGSAFAGAVLGAIVSNPRDAGIGALVGAVAGTAVGAASDASRAQANAQVVANVQSRQSAQVSAQEAQADGYRRALSACLVGRGYTVR
jgi:hypothetical protein